jgi:lysophospholipase L1-like esterase
MEKGYREILRRIKERAPAVRVHVQSLLPTSKGFADRNESVQDFNRRIKKMAGEHGYDFMDLHALFADEKGELKPDFTEDGLHLTDAGYQVWRAEIEKTMGWTTPKETRR